MKWCIPTNTITVEYWLKSNDWKTSNRSTSIVVIPNWSLPQAGRNSGTSSVAIRLFGDANGGQGCTTQPWHFWTTSWWSLMSTVFLISEDVGNVGIGLIKTCQDCRHLINGSPEWMFLWQCFFALDRGDWIMINLQVCMSNAIVAQIATSALNGLDGWQYFKLRTGVHCVSKPLFSTKLQEEASDSTAQTRNKTLKTL